MSAIVKKPKKVSKEERPKKAKRKMAQHSSASPDFGTPEYILEPTREVFGGTIDLDPCTSELFNRVVQATTYFDRKMNGLIRSWFGNTIVNPPGEDHGEAVKLFWEKAVNEYACGNVRSIMWIGFNIEQMQQLQRTRVDANPFMFPTCIPHKRIPFNTAERDHQVQLFGGEKSVLVQTNRPAKANFITLLPDRSRPWQVDVFRRAFLPIGQVR